MLAAGGEVIAFCDADDEVVDGWVQAAWDALITGLDVVTGYVHGYASQIAGPDGTEILRESHALRVPVPTCNCAVVREAFLRLGGFDESFNRYGHEDSEFSIRARLAGLRIGFYPPMQLRFSATEDLMTLSRKLFHSGQAEVRMWVRHPEVFPNQNDLKSVTDRFGQWVIKSVRRPLLMKERKHVRQGLTSFGNVVGVLKGKRKGWGNPELIPPANRK
ncbi:hypothetical protein BHE16_04660 [Neomicrococcus aestuarii]|uniref:Galactosyltransferase C-terminal domain-containing protein n=1 Tax=Neomicrococcus aestuarii TaxID=556325 RepID=A0A1L2ZN12_9MICC|nr:hypothetical protein BHE16_04660 [Neomicrococcus aestuarii]